MVANGHVYDHCDDDDDDDDHHEGEDRESCEGHEGDGCEREGNEGEGCEGEDCEGEDHEGEVGEDHLSIDGAEPWKRPHAPENMLLWRLPLQNWTRIFGGEIAR